MTTQNVTEWRGQELLDNDGQKIGSIEEIYPRQDKDVIEDEHQVSETVAKEQVEIDGAEERR